MALIIYLAIKVLLLLVEAINLNTVCVKKIAVIKYIRLPLWSACSQWCTDGGGEVKGGKTP